MNDSLCVILHGGAGHTVEKNARLKLPVLKLAVDNAWQALIEGKSGVIAVAAALRVLEGSEYFNAGFGGYPNVNGCVLLDVGLMKGTREFVSLINVRRVKYPSAIALDMLDEHSGLVTLWTYEHEQNLDKASAEIKQRYGLVKTHEDMIAPFVKHLLKHPDEFELTQADEDSIHGTVGCVVRDARGHLHAGTSTAGIGLKYNGRVGDSPIIGSGVFADNEIGALSATGNGEAIIRSVVSSFVIAEMRHELRKDPNIFVKDPEKLHTIISRELGELDRKTVGQSAALIVVPARGVPQYEFNSEMVSIGLRYGSATKIKQEKVIIARQNKEDIIFADLD